MAAGEQVIGRSGELDALAAFVHGVAEGPSALVFEGEAGAGKTTLWLAGVALARESGAQVLSARPVAAETQLGLAAVADMLEGALERILPVLPRPQAEALRIALLLERPSGAAPQTAHWRWRAERGPRAGPRATRRGRGRRHPVAGRGVGRRARIRLAKAA